MGLLVRVFEKVWFLSHNTNAFKVLINVLIGLKTFTALWCSNNQKGEYLTSMCLSQRLNSEDLLWI